MKLCKDCKHFVPNTQDWEAAQHQIKYAICGLTSRVTGFDGNDCRIEQEPRLFLMNHCGPDGKKWEAKA